MIAALMLAGVVAIAQPMEVGASPATTQADTPVFAPDRLTVPFELDRPIHVEATSTVAFRRARFINEEQVATRSNRYELSIEGMYKPMLMLDNGQPAQFELTVDNANRLLESQSVESLVPSETEIYGTWGERAPHYTLPNGAILMGADRMDLSALLGPNSPDAPTLTDIAAWPEGAELGDRWTVNLVAWRQRLTEIGYVVGFQDVGGEATFAEIDGDPDHARQKVAVVRMLLWADNVRHRGQPRNYSGQIEIRYTLFVPLDGGTAWREVSIFEQSYEGEDVGDPRFGDTRSEIFARRTSDVRWDTAGR
ncbi:MAG: hypothetical protein AAGD32_09300 [Planctomycetota bacterium]